MMRHPGNTLVEYSLLIGLIAVMSFMAVSGLQGSLSGLFGKQESQLSSQPVSDYVTLTSFGSASAQVNQSSMSQQPVPGSGVSLAQTTGDSVNTTSTDGLVESAQHTLSLVKKMNTLSQGLTDPKVMEWAKKITQQTHYLAGTEGDYSGVQKLSVETEGNTSYTSANALQDLYLYRNSLQTLITHPPKQGNPEEIKQVLALAKDALQNTQPYLKQLDPYLDNKSGKLNRGRLAKSQLAQDEYKMTGKRYQNLMKYDALQDNVQQVLEDGSASEIAPLQSTLQDASDLNNTSQ